MSERSEFMNFSFENKINKIIFQQQDNFLLVRFLCLHKENEQTIYQEVFMSKNFLKNLKSFLSVFEVEGCS